MAITAQKIQGAVTFYECGEIREYFLSRV